MELISKRLVYRLSVGLFITSLIAYFIFVLKSIPFTFLLCIPITLSAYLNNSSRDKSAKKKDFVFICFFTSLCIGHFTDFFLENQELIQFGKLTPGHIYSESIKTYGHDKYKTMQYSFVLGDSIIYASKELSLFDFKYKKGDSIWVLYSKRNLEISDIYTKGGKPNIDERKNYIKWFFNNNSLFKWILSFFTFYFLIIIMIRLSAKQKNNR